MTKYWLIYIVALTLMCLGAFGLLHRAHVEIQDVRAERDMAVEARNRAVERMKLDGEVLVARQAQIASQARKLKDVQNRLSAALERNKAWSDADVPPDIIGGLAGPSGALPDGLPVGTEGQDCEGTPSSCPVTGVPSTVP